MPDVIVDYVVRQSGNRWSVVRRTLDTMTIWLSHASVSTHCAKAEAEAAMQRLNLPKRPAGARRRRTQPAHIEA